jgi:2',3'-cyclic-nucleotide 2'-phosphodiesterase/3'-nucleotidase
MTQFMKHILSLCATLALAVSCGLQNGNYTIQLLTTNDVHGAWFDSTYVGGKVKNSLYAVKYYVDSVRNAAGEDNVVLVDAGDCLQGDNAPYYYNYVDTTTEHLYAKLAKYMQYDAITVGNHDIETGHHVYDRVASDLNEEGIPFLAANAIRTDNSKPYFQEYTCVEKDGLKVCIIGFTNPNMKEWLDESLFSGMEFKSLIPFVQNEVDKIVKKEKPQVVIVSVHSGTGDGDGSILESQGLDLFKSLKGVDFVVCSHDHRPFVKNGDGICLINSGSHSRFVGHGTISLKVKHHRIVSKELKSDLIKVNPNKVDTVMRNKFHKYYEAVKSFTMTKVGMLSSDLDTKDAYAGMNEYMNLIHTISLSCKPAQISFAAPLTYNGHVDAGTLIYNDLFTIYPFENQLYVVKMTGKEIKNYLEYSYDQWIQTATSKNDHVLKIEKGSDTRFNQDNWHFVNRSYNFDSAAGINYTVDVTKPFGERITISSMADGTAFDLASTYNVAMTSYRASGGGDLLQKGAGVNTDKIQERVVARYPEIRNLLFDYLKEKHDIDPVVIGDTKIIGDWEFVPVDIAQPAIKADMSLLFKN